jgi:hypothetical protein
MNDGNVIVGSRPRTLSILDGGTLNEAFSLQLPSCLGSHIRSSNMPVTLDGRVWLSIDVSTFCGSSVGRLGWFDPDTRAFTLFPVEQHPLLSSDSFRNGPNFVMPGNGDRLVLDTDADSRYAPQVYFDVTDPVFQYTTPGTSRWFLGASSSNDGRRAMWDSNRVVDEQFRTVGRIFLPDYTAPAAQAYVMAGVLSPEGARAYVLSYRSTDIGLPTTANPTRIFVLDVSGDVGDTGVPVLGHFEVPDNPGCLTTSNCRFRMQAQISADGRTLFFIGDEKLVVAPIPNTFSTIYSASPGVGAMKPVRWNLPNAR